MAEEKAEETKVVAKEKETKVAKETKTKATKEAKKWSSKIKKLGDEIVGLTLMDATCLCDYLKEEYGIEPAAAGVVSVAGLGGQDQAEKEEEKTSFNVILKEFGDKKIQVIKEVRAVTGLGLKEAKNLVDNVPKPVKENLSKSEAESIQTQLEAVGAVVELD